ncbi:histidinol-phosphate transaminase [Porticoccus sp.]
MSVDLKTLALPGVQHLQPYQGGKPVEELERELGITGVIKLASNENPLGLSVIAKAAIDKALKDGARYPDGNGFYLKSKLAELLGVDAKQLTLGNGSNDVLELLARAYLGSQHNAVVAEHAFIVYQLVITAQNAKVVIVPARNWGHDLSAMADAVDEHTRLLFIANPNNPTGTWASLDEIDRLLQQVPEHVLVVVDEAYYEYAVDGEYDTALKLIGRYPNLVVTRTFSKAYGLAALRLGYAVSHPDVADILNRLRQPFNVNSLALAAAQAVLDDSDYLRKSIECNRQGYEQLTAGFEQLGLSYIPSAGNFVAVQIPGNVPALYQALLHRGIIVRPIALYGMPDHLRISIGLPEENQRFLDTVAQLLSEGAEA